jgi:hypothetical protein
MHHDEPGADAPRYADWPFSEPERVIKVIVPLGDVPLGATITKRTGTQQFIVANRIRIFSDSKTELNPKGKPKKECREIAADENVRFIVHRGTDITAMPVDTEVVWFADASDLMDYLDPPEDK